MDINLINYNDIQKIRIAYNLCIKCAKPYDNLHFDNDGYIITYLGFLFKFEVI